jgi:hypothetical protein
MRCAWSRLWSFQVRDGRLVSVKTATCADPHVDSGEWKAPQGQCPLKVAGWTVEPASWWPSRRVRSRAASRDRKRRKRPL